MTGKTRRWLSGVAGGVALVLAAGVSTPVATAAEQADHAATKAVLDQYLAQAGPGAAVHAGNAADAWTLTTGTARINENRPLTQDDHFRIGSQTKTFTAAVVLQLVDAKLVELDAPIGRYLPGVVTGAYDGNVITVRQLLQHTSGIVRDIRDAAANPDGTYPLAELVRSAMDEPALFPPGTKQEYSNVGYLVLGMLIERITGQSAGDAITDRIIKPLGLAETSFPAPKVRALADPYLPGYLGTRVGPFFFWVDATTATELSFWSTAGAMASTLDDLAEFYRALLGGRVFSAAALAEMRRTFPPSDAYGLALSKLPLSCGGVAWGHNGSLPTGHYSITLVTDDGRFASVVTNTNRFDSKPSAIDVANSALCEGKS
ncbi:serine hydrolase domain-containing protein [Amycolatopsis nigrescens]|uniref:serine hydrolase domain-containing protein n=1 Tax=Amycolatopsis nigrescens TaxID=381445 RepID=UPI00037D1CE0|nr:serine hydrolase domain-containing protein [Amycolatopsis nigrescens]